VYTSQAPLYFTYKKSVIRCGTAHVIRNCAHTSVQGTWGPLYTMHFYSSGRLYTLHSHTHTHTHTHIHTHKYTHTCTHTYTHTHTQCSPVLSSAQELCVSMGSLHPLNIEQFKMQGLICEHVGVRFCGTPFASILQCAYTWLFSRVLTLPACKQCLKQCVLTINTCGLFHVCLFYQCPTSSSSRLRPNYKILIFMGGD
jgi:hypothetical protein